MFQKNISLNIFKVPLSFYKYIKDGYITLQKAEEQKNNKKT